MGPSSLEAGFYCPILVHLADFITPQMARQIIPALVQRGAALAALVCRLVLSGFPDVFKQCGASQKRVIGSFWRNLHSIETDEERKEEIWIKVEGSRMERSGRINLYLMPMSRHVIRRK